MIVQQADPLIVIRQTDHAYLAGFFARELGNEAFPKPEPFPSFCLAAAEHDNGWQEWELAPAIDPKSFHPYTFMSIPTAEHVAVYQRGIERAGCHPGSDAVLSLEIAASEFGRDGRYRAAIPEICQNRGNIPPMILYAPSLQQLRLKVDLRANPR
jgi:hypothetical protein